MTAKERRALLKDLRKFNVQEWVQDQSGLVRIVFASERAGSGIVRPEGDPVYGSRSTQQQSEPPRESENPYRELAGAVGLDWERISGSQTD